MTARAVPFPQQPREMSAYIRGWTPAPPPEVWHTDVVDGTSRTYRVLTPELASWMLDAFFARQHLGSRSR